MVWKRIIIIFLTCTTRCPRGQESKGGGKIHASSRRSAGFYIFSHSKNVAQSKKFLHQLLSKHQYTILRELVINDLAGNLPTYSSTKKKAKLRKSLKKRLEHLARGQYHKDYLPILFPYLQLLTIHTLQFHGICK